MSNKSYFIYIDMPNFYSIISAKTMGYKERPPITEKRESLVSLVKPAAERALWPFLPVAIPPTALIPNSPNNLLRYLTFAGTQYPDALDNGGTLPALIQDVITVTSDQRPDNQYKPIMQALNEFVPLENNAPEQNLPFGLLVALYFGSHPRAFSQIDGLIENPVAFKKKLTAGEVHLNVFGEALLYPYFNVARTIGGPDNNPLAELVEAIGQASMQRALRFRQHLTRANIFEMTQYHLRTASEQEHEDITDELMRQFTKTSLFSAGSIIPSAAVFRFAGKQPV